VEENNQFKVYYKSNQSSVIKDFITSKKNSKAIEFIQSSNIKFNNCKIHSIFTIGKQEKLRDANKFLNSKFNLSIDFYHDIYNDSYWLEINPLKATKGQAVLLLKERFEFDRIISFGDNLNDLSMFHRSDLSHGMSSGNLKIRSHVSKIIGTNDEDSVAKEINCIYLEKNSQYKEIS